MNNEEYELLNSEFKNEELEDLEEITTIDELVDEYLDDFEYQIKSRGKEYYEKGNIKSLVKSGTTFYAKVEGTKDYTVKIYFDLIDDYMDYECDCPYEFPCKHIYAVLLAIKDKAYSEEEIKPFIERKTSTIEDMVKLIPAEKIKEYLLSDWGKDYVCFEEEHFNEYFAEYLPKQDYDYYYNNLYNTLILDGYNTDILEKYLDEIKVLMNKKDYKTIFNIIKAIIEASHDTKHINKWHELINSFPLIAINFRIVYRKCDDSFKDEIETWKHNLEESNYYDSVYLEDILLSVK